VNTVDRLAQSPPEVVVHRADARFTTRTDWLDSRQSFSFGHHYDPQNTRHGLLLVNNDNLVQAGAGFELHRHQDMEILTWVLQGSLAHRDSAGHSGILHPGLVQRMSAGSGILHSESNHARGLQPGAEDHQPVHFIHMWVAPDRDGVEPGYEQRDVAHALRSGRLVPVASGRPEHAGTDSLALGNRNAALHAARLQPGQGVELPDAPFLHLFVAYGGVSLEGAGPLSTGDAVRFTGTGGQRLTAGQPSEVLVWEMHAARAAQDQR